MKDYVNAMLGKPIAGIPDEHWTRFFQLHAEARDPSRILATLESQLAESRGTIWEEIEEAVRQFVNLFR